MSDTFKQYQSKLVRALSEDMKYHMQKNVSDMDLENTDLNDIYQDKLYEVLRMIENTATELEGYTFVEIDE